MLAHNAFAARVSDDVVYSLGAICFPDATGLGVGEALADRQLLQSGRAR